MCIRGVLKEVLLNKEIFQVIHPSVDMKIDSINSGEITNQMLFGEYFKVLKYKSNNVYGYSLIDNYYGWLERKKIGKIKFNTHFISCIRGCVLSEPDIKSPLITFLPMRSNIKVLSIKDCWAKVELNSNLNKKYGFISQNQIIRKDYSLKNFVEFAKKFIGVPYRWGGRNSIGVDCSALIQISMAFSGINLPRDSYDQYMFFKSNKNFILKDNPSDLNFLKKGNLVYWPGHIGIMVNKKSIIHASGHHSLVLVENLSDALKRISLSPTYITQKELK